MIGNVLETAIIRFLDLYKMILVVRILLTWFPNINWWNQPFKAMRDITDPVLEPCRRIIPPIGGFDFSPIVLFFGLEALQYIIQIIF